MRNSTASHSFAIFDAFSGCACLFYLALAIFKTFHRTAHSGLLHSPHKLSASSPNSGTRLKANNIGMNGPQVHFSALTQSTMHVPAHTVMLGALYHATHAPSMCTRTRGGILLCKTVFNQFSRSSPDLASPTEALQQTYPQALNQLIPHKNYTTLVGFSSDIHLRQPLHCVQRREYIL